MNSDDDVRQKTGSTHGMTGTPFTIREESIGLREKIVTLERFAEAPGEKNRILSSGHCYFCGYDRGVRKTHTEVPGEVIYCHNCEQRLLVNKP